MFLKGLMALLVRGKDVPGKDIFNKSPVSLAGLATEGGPTKSGGFVNPPGAFRN